VLMSRDHTNPSMCPDSIYPEVIKIIPQKKERTIRRHVTRMESQRRPGTHIVFAPPPSPVISSKYSFISENSTFIKPKNVPN
jgi:hypothetical protein